MVDNFDLESKVVIGVEVRVLSSAPEEFSSVSRMKITDTARGWIVLPQSTTTGVNGDDMQLVICMRYINKTKVSRTLELKGSIRVIN